MKSNKKLITNRTSKRRYISNHTKSKRRYNQKKSISRKHNKKGGLLIMNPETDLINTHLCNTKADSDKSSPGLEIFNSISKAFQLNMSTLGYLQQMYKNTDNKWFKFIIFNNNHTYYIYIIDGAKINKHPVCVLQGLLEVTKSANEYTELRNAVDNLQLFKNSYGSNMDAMTDELKSQCLSLIDQVNALIDKDIRCMPIISSGSGSVNEDNSICINNKSGHYKPTKESMMNAKKIFQMIVGETVPIYVKNKEDKNVLKEKYGEKAEHYSGICLPN